MTKYIMYFPTFEAAFINWMIQLYQPMSMCENASFRTLCQSLSPKAPLLGREKVRLILTKQVAEVIALLLAFLRSQAHQKLKML
jgi:hypothetical protein